MLIHMAPFKRHSTPGERLALLVLSMLYTSQGCVTVLTVGGIVPPNMIAEH